MFKILHFGSWKNSHLSFQPKSSLNSRLLPKKGPSHQRYYSEFSQNKFPLLCLDASEVLFPGCVLPVCIKEPKHHLLLKHILEGSKEFGYCISRKEGSQIIEPVEFGTKAILEERTERSDGNVDIRLRGGQRFRVIGIPKKNLYGIHEAEIEPLEEDPIEKGKPTAKSIEECKTIEGILKTKEIAPKVWEKLKGERPSPKNPMQFSFWVSFTLPFDRETKVKQLACKSTVQRLAVAHQLLKDRILRRKKIKEEILDEKAKLSKEEDRENSKQETISIQLESPKPMLTKEKVSSTKEKVSSTKAKDSSTITLMSKLEAAAATKSSKSVKKTEAQKKVEDKYSKTGKSTKTLNTSKHIQTTKDKKKPKVSETKTKTKTRVSKKS